MSVYIVKISLIEKNVLVIFTLKCFWFLFCFIGLYILRRDINLAQSLVHFCPSQPFNGIVPKEDL